MTDVPIKISRRGAVLEVEINRPRINALDPQTSQLLGEVFVAFRNDDAFRAAILTGTGNEFFCAGRDPAAATMDDANLVDHGSGGFGGLREIANLNKPVIAAVNGMAMGGGMELALVADMVFASSTARFCLPEVRSGAAPAAAAVALPRRIPHHIAMEMLLTGRWMEAKEAMRWGLVNEIAEPENVMDRARDVARMLAEGAPLALAAIKEIVRESEDMAFQDALGRIAGARLPAAEALRSSEDLREGRRALAEKRKPIWRGR